MVGYDCDTNHLYRKTSYYYSIMLIESYHNFHIQLTEKQGLQGNVYQFEKLVIMKKKLEGILFYFCSCFWLERIIMDVIHIHT